MSKKKYLSNAIIMIVLSLIIAFTFSVSVFAEGDENQKLTDIVTGEVGIKANVSNDIQLAEGDIFILTYRVFDKNLPNEEQTGEKAQIKIDASLINGEWTFFNMPVGYYQITKIEYQGSNSDIANGHYGCSQYFSASENARNSLYLAIGEKAWKSLKGNGSGEGKVIFKGYNADTEKYDNPLQLTDEIIFDTTPTDAVAMDALFGNQDVTSPSDAKRTSKDTSKEVYDDTYDEYGDDYGVEQQVKVSDEEPEIEYYDLGTATDNDAEELAPQPKKNNSGIFWLIFIIAVLGIFFAYKKGILGELINKFIKK